METTNKAFGVIVTCALLWMGSALLGSEFPEPARNPTPTPVSPGQAGETQLPRETPAPRPFGELGKLPEFPDIPPVAGQESAPPVLPSDSQLEKAAATEKKPASQATPIVRQWPELRETNQARPALETSSAGAVSQEKPAVEQTSNVEQQPAAEEKPAMERKPAEEQKPAVEQKPAEEQTAVEEQKPAEEEKPDLVLPEGGNDVMPPFLREAYNQDRPSIFALTPRDFPLGFAGRSGVAPRDVQQDDHFVPIEDRWRIGFPEWDRYGKGHPAVDDYPYVKGHWWDPYNQNVLKGDYPIIGQHIFLEVNATYEGLFEPRQVPTATTPFESTVNPNSARFFGNPNQFFSSQFFSLSFDLFHGDAAFKPVDWKIRLTPVLDVNTLSASELTVVSPDVRQGTSRYRTFGALQEWFVETKLADLGPNYDFVSVRAGSQPFTSDFRGFIFSDVNRGVRLFGNRNSNREQFNLAIFSQLEKDTNSGLNSFHDRHQQVAIANYYIQDFIFPGYTAQVSAHYNHDEPTFKFDNNGFLVRPDPVGVFKPHRLDVAYLGWTGDGHINRFNVNHAFYWAVGYDSLNPMANSAQHISAEMGALELSYDRDWIRFRTSLFWASGDRDASNSHATGFDTILDNPNFAGGEFSYWQRQTIRLFGVNLVQRQSLVPDLRSSKIQGQSNFVNPGLFLVNGGMDFEITPKCRLISNINFLWFDDTSSLRQFVFQENINTNIGTDISLGCEYRPLLNNNILMTFGVSTLLPGRGFKDLYNDLGRDVSPLFAGFLDLILTF